MPCPSCASPSLERVVRGPDGSWALWRCRQCGLYPVLPLPTQRETYGKTYFERTTLPDTPRYSGYLSYDRDREGRKKDFRRLFRPYVTPSNTVLDIGCATGTALEALRDLGVAENQLTGLDISEYAIREAGARLPNARFFRQDVAAGLSDGSFRLILLLDILEHVPDPAAIFHDAAGHLAPGGVMLISTPDPESWMRKSFGWRWTEFHDGEHLCFLSTAWLENAAASSGLQVADIARIGRRMSLDHFAARARSYLPFFPALPSSRALSINVRDQLFAVLKKPNP
ncbi:methyltransferase domain-containing protein [Candidatus Uhrbacteria bacterium]|nr:methyltransferase domain-containing protein [Candidatus Uhrbacteria bacterium]